MSKKLWQPTLSYPRIASTPVDSNGNIVSNDDIQVDNLRFNRRRGHIPVLYGGVGVEQPGELSFLDIGHNPDCIGGSRANGIFLANFGLRNYQPRGVHHQEEFNTILSIAHSKIVCAYGNNAYNFSSALGDLAQSKYESEFSLHVVSFSTEQYDFFMSTIHPRYVATRFKRDTASYIINCINYKYGIDNYIKRLKEMRSYIRKKIEDYGPFVTSGRKTKIIFFNLSAEQWHDLTKDKTVYRDFMDLYLNSAEEKIVIVPLCGSVVHIPPLCIKYADMVLSYGKSNVSHMQKIYNKMGVNFSVAPQFEKMRTAGIVYDSIGKYNFYPLLGYTKEFFIAHNERTEWEKKEKEAYKKYLSLLDDGTKYDQRNNHALQKQQDSYSQLYARPEFLEREKKSAPRLKPRIIFQQ